MGHIVGYFGCAAISIAMMVMLFHALVWPMLKHRKKSVLGWIVSVVFGFGMLHSMAVKPGGGDALQAPRRRPPQQGIAPTNSAAIATTTNAPPWETALAISHLETTSSNVQLTVAWPMGFYSYDPIFDLFIAYPTLTNDWQWASWQSVASTATSCSFTITSALLGLNELPPGLFARATERTESCETMDDPDGDGIPNTFEFYHGTNPYIPDANLIQTLDCADTDFSTLKSVLANSTEYSIINLPTGTIDAAESVVMPPHPVLLSGPKDGYTVIKSTADLGAFMFKDGQCSHTLVRNVYLNLLKRGSFQVGFWCGGNLPWASPGATPTFENVVVRTPRPETQYIGWLFYGDNGETSTLKNCLVNALGATNVRGVEIGNGPRVDLTDCSFIHFPSNGLATLPRTFSPGNTGTTNVIVRQGAEASVSVDLTPGIDSDGDGYTNIQELEELHTDPWLADSDGDGMSDPDELIAGTDPMDVLSFIHGIFIHVTNTTTVAGSSVAVEIQINEGNPTVITNSPLRSFDCTFELPNSMDKICVIAFRDLNGDGVFNPDSDVVLTKTISGHEQSSHLKLTFGDVDNDGVDNHQERLDRTDPYSSSSLRIRRKLALNDDNADFDKTITNIVSFGASTNACDIFKTVIFTDDLTTTISTNTHTGHLVAILIRDLNKNGVYDEGVDARRVFTFGNGTDDFKIGIGDSDGDGIADSQELAGGTNPIDARNYMLDASVYYECIDSSADITNYIQLAANQSELGTASICSFTGAASPEFHVVGEVTNGNFYARCFRDLNRNGILDENSDVVITNSLGSYLNKKLNGLLIGDQDNDGVSDTDEFLHNTDPMSKLKYQFNLDLAICGVFSNATYLTAMVTFGDATLVEPGLASNRTFQCHFNDLHAQNGEKVVVTFWDDANANCLIDTGETFTKQSFSPNGYNTSITTTLKPGAFDTDSDGIPDSWETTHRLSPSDPQDALADNDSDGLINLHEYYCCCDPWNYDGTNTAIHSFCHSIDDRVSSLPRKQKATYATNITGGRRNANCWAYGIDLTCASPDNTTQRRNRAGTAVSRRHIIFANHYQIGNGAIVRFVEEDGTILERTLSAKRTIIGTDLTIGVLSADLPESITPASILPSSFEKHLADCKRIPMLMFDQYENAIVTDSNALRFDSTSSDGLLPKNDDRLYYFENVESGDSGDPKFFISDNSAILTTTLYSSGIDNSGTGHFVTFFKQRIQRVMDFLCPGYILNEFDFTPFEEINNEN